LTVGGLLSPVGVMVVGCVWVLDGCMRQFWGRRLLDNSLCGAFLGASLLALALFGAGVSPAFAAAGHGPKVERRLAAELDGASGSTVRVIAYGPEARAILGSAGGRHVKQLDLLRGASAEVPAAAVDGIAARAGISFVGVDVPVVPTSLGDALVPVYAGVDGAPAAWSQGLDGSGVGVAVIDSGISAVPDLAGRVVQVPVGSAAGTGDAIGHGTFVASVLAGLSVDGRYLGVAPGARLFALDVDSGSGIYTSDVVLALGWVAANAAGNGIRVVNLSLSETAPSSYRTSALDYAVEAVWRSGVTVVVAAGNSGAGQIDFAPANDPFVLTVGASDANGTALTRACAFFCVSVGG
jgi:serine protease AprX